MRLALYEPDIAQNTGSLIRLGACLGVPIDIIEPCGFVFADRHMRRAGMDYLEKADFTRHTSWAAFCAARQAAGARTGRIVLLTAKARTSYTNFTFAEDDTLLLGRESAGVPQDVHDTADARLTIPMVETMRSINVAQAAAMVLGEALRQTKGFVQI